MQIQGIVHNKLHDLHLPSSYSDGYSCLSLHKIVTTFCLTSRGFLLPPLPSLHSQDTENKLVNYFTHTVYTHAQTSLEVESYEDT